MKKKLALLFALIFYVSILPPLYGVEIKGNFSDIITKGPWVDVRAYGAATTNTAAQNNAAFAAAIAALPEVSSNGAYDNSAGTIKVPPGRFLISDSILFDALVGITFEGSGPRSTILVWDGGASTPALRIYGSRDCNFRDFAIESSSTKPLDIAVILETHVGLSIAANSFKNIFIQGTNNGGLQKGFVTKAGDGGDANNDFHSWDGVRVYNYSKAGWSFEHSQSKAHTLIGTTAIAVDGVGEAGYATIYGTSSSGGSFQCYSCNSFLNTIADFYLGTPNDYVSVYGGNSEGSKQLLKLPPTGSGFTVSVQNYRFALTGLGTDNRVISFEGPGPLVLMNNWFTSGLDNIPTTIFWNKGGSDIPTSGSFIAIGNRIDTTLADPWEGFEPTIALGNTRSTNSNATLVRLPNILEGPLVMPPISYQTLDAAGDSISPNAEMVQIYNASGVLTLTSTPTITAGEKEGQALTILHVGSDNVLLQSEAVLSGSGLRLTTDNVTLTSRGSIQFRYTNTGAVFSGGIWVQTGAVVVIP